MAKSVTENFDKYVIERDERDIGGGITVIATFETWQVASKVWNAMPVPEDEKVQLWLVRWAGGVNSPATCTAIDVKCK